MNFRKLMRIMGPGLLYAGAAIGVSHLVQSTRAGASYGYDLLWILLLVNILKYPFFEYGTRYANITGKSLISGYRAIGKWATIMFGLLTISTMFAILAAVTIVTAGLASHIFNSQLSLVSVSAIILSSTIIILMIGRYAALDMIIKIVIIILALSTLIAVVSAIGNSPIDLHAAQPHFDWLKRVDILFLIAFIGWMPAPIDVSVWQSLWTVAKQKQLKRHTSLKDALLDFKIGYIGTILMASGFLALGALIMWGSGESLSASGVVFADQLINLYTSSIGAWAYPIIAVASLTTMFSTTLTCLDAYPRVMRPLTEMAMPKVKKIEKNSSLLYWIWIVILGAGSLVFIGFLADSMRFMVDLATTLSFITAPILAYLNYRVVTDEHFPEESRPSAGLRILSKTSIVFLSLFTLAFLLWRFIL